MIHTIWNIHYSAYEIKTLEYLLLFLVKLPNVAFIEFNSFSSEDKKNKIVDICGQLLIVFSV